MPARAQKEESLKHAIIIAKEFARGGSSQAVANVLRNVYEEMNKIKDEIPVSEVKAESKPEE
ncbi:MAG: hypothetical protein JRI72_04890 [Deltaproteobacteria bacterium]|nr:hypothetical protein [Deltaproteobacteria bacterium]